MSLERNFNAFAWMIWIFELYQNEGKYLQKDCRAYRPTISLVGWICQISCEEFMNFCQGVCLDSLLISLKNLQILIHA